VTPLVAATVFGRTSKAVAAAILNLAVAGKIRVLDQGEMAEPARGIRSHRGAKVLQDFVLELVSSGGVTSEETALLGALFGAELKPGSHRELSVVDAGVNRKIAKVRAKVLKASQTSGIRGTIGKALPAVLIVVALLALLTGIPLAISLANEGFGGPLPFLLAMLLLVSAFLTLVFSVNVHPLTEAGAALRDHLRGLREFIALAEADRLRVLQSPTGALRVPVDVNDKRARLMLTEKVLPFAVLFNLEKEWSQELANLYAENDAQPTWYAGGPTFNAMIFAASLNTFSTALSTSWTASSSSSSMGGSGGGGFSGGGGGGGGGGGV